MNVMRNLGLGLILAGAIPGMVLLAQEPPTPPPAPDATPPQMDADFFKANQDLMKLGALAGRDHAHFKQMHLQSQAQELAQKYIKAEKEEEKNGIRRQLTKVLTEQFDLHMQQQQKELEELEKQISSLRELLKKRQESKGAIVQRRIEQLAEDAKGLGWLSPSSPHSWSFGLHGGMGLQPPPPPRAKKSETTDKK
jgi:hypothetical protein